VCARAREVVDPIAQKVSGVILKVLIVIVGIFFAFLMSMAGGDSD